MDWKNLFKAPVLMKAGWYARGFRRAARDVRASQRRVLLDKLQRHRDSRFGRDHGFQHVRTVEDFRRAVPVAGYDYFEPYINDVKRGDTRALFGPDERVLMFAMTSGTCAQPKYIPVTVEFLKEYKRGWQVWGYFVFKRHRRAYERSILQIVSPSNEEYTETGVPCGSISGLIAEMQPTIIRMKYIPPTDVARLKHAESKYYLTGRIALTRRVSLISTANPSSVLSVVRAVDENRERIIRDVHDGTVDSCWEVPDDLKRRLRRHLRPSPRRARQLEEIVSRTGRLLPRDYWSDLRVIGNWKGGSCGVYLGRYPEYFGDTCVCDIGLLASEGRMSIPVEDEGCSGVLDVWSHFFEFIPEREIESDSPTVLQAHELERDTNYFLIVTTSSGLYRYNIMDLVRVTGFFENTPMVQFLNKGHYFSSLTGEKLSEFQVVESLRRAHEGLGRGPETVIVSPMWDDPPRYSLALEQCEDYTDEFLRAFADAFERSLQEINIEYRTKRQSGRLGGTVVHSVSPGAFSRIKEERLAQTRGRREQYKHRFLVSDMDYHRRLSVVETLEKGPKLKAEA